MDWLASTLSIWGMYLAGRKDKDCWIISFFTQFIYLYFNFKYELYGFIPLSILVMIMSVYNYIKWSRGE